MLKNHLRRKEIADHITACLCENLATLRNAFAVPGRVHSCWVDGLLPDPVARLVFANFPPVDRMMFKNSIKERKYVSAQMNEHPPILEETVFAFQDPRVLKVIADITGLVALEPDSHLYAGGISSMSKGHYLKPHLDNSHNRDGTRYRVLNLLYYVTPDWREEYGGNLELWDHGPRGEPRAIPSLFNRLVLMITNRSSWHSVSEVLHDGSRCCVSNYYFSNMPPEENAYFHATSFRGRPEEALNDLVMAADNALRTGVLKILGNKVYRNPHVYKRPDPK